MATLHSRRTAKRAAADRITFLKSLADKPVLTGAVAPSGKALSRLMASYADPDDPRPVLELGPGTGVVTAALIERGIPAEKIVAVEFNSTFCRMLSQRFTGLTVVHGDAYNLAATLPSEQSGPFSTVISSLPLITRPPEIRRAFVEQVLALSAPDRPLVQFSYSLFPPVRPVPGRFTTECSKWVIMNLPPARVWLYRPVA